MSFQQIHNEGATAWRCGKSMLENPFYRPENLPQESAAAYRAWQIKAEAWERGWREQDRLAKRSHSPLRSLTELCA